MDDILIDVDYVRVQEWVDTIHRHFDAYLVDYEVTKLFKVDLVEYPQVDVTALVASMGIGDEPNKEPLSVDDILFEPIPKKEPEPVKDDATLDDYLYEGMSCLEPDGCENDCNCFG